MKTPALLAILDGVGLSDTYEGNAFLQADVPFMRSLFTKENPAFCTLNASGRDVGLPEGQMGNSEVGHLNIGSGRIVNQELTRIDLAIEDGSLYENEVLCSAIDKVVEAQTTLHLMGLLSDGGVHSSQAHLEALLAMAAHRGAKHVRVHVFLDGRDVAPTSGATYVSLLNKYIEGLVSKHLGLDMRVATVCGRYYAMDRDQRWSRVERAWRALVVPYEPDVKRALGSEDAEELIKTSYNEGVTDEFFEPLALGDTGIRDDDCLICFNFRPDRAREITRAFMDPDFETYGFKRPLFPQLTFVSLTEYDPLFEETFSVKVAFNKEFPKNTLADYIASKGLRQLHIAETEKYAHVTFFFNGGVEKPKEAEERILIPSPKVATYDLQPEMSAPQVSAALTKAINEDQADLYIVNFANGDMVGHTGSMQATIKALEAVDTCLKEVVDAIVAKGGSALITADHGNSEQMLAEDGSPWTAHTTSQVPLAFISAGQEHEVILEQRADARLADIAPTLLAAMGLEIPEEFTGVSLLHNV